LRKCNVIHADIKGRDSRIFINSRYKSCQLFN
jgi:hypothetical protein